MRATSISKLLTLLLALALALPARADDEEVITDELPDWARAELEDARAWELQVAGMAPNYGADIPSPEEVVYGRAPAAPAAAPVQAQVSEPENLTFDDFREGLAPHGRWIHTPEYGLVFVPTRSTQVEGWRPYLYGQWVWTQYGWTWVSDEPFGWATYHYGRWGHKVGIGWFWVPGYVWAPAWVAWRHGPDSIGWAPLYPGYVRVTASYPVYVDHWIFVSHGHFHAHPVHRHWHRHKHHHHFHRSHWAKHWRSAGRVYAGPPRRWLERRGTVIREVRIVHVHKPAPSRVVSVGGRRQVELYRPSAVRPVNRRPAPAALRAARPTVGSGLVRGAPARVEPRRTSPARVDSGRKSPTRVEPRRTSPARVDSGRKSPARVEPRRTSPARVDSGRKSPARVESRTTPSRVAPARAAPSRSASSRPSVSSGSRTAPRASSSVRSPARSAPKAAPAGAARPARSGR